MTVQRKSIGMMGQRVLSYKEYEIFPQTCKNGKCHECHNNAHVKCVGLGLKGHPTSEDMRYGEEENFSPNTLIFAAIESQLRI